MILKIKEVDDTIIVVDEQDNLIEGVVYACLTLIPGNLPKLDLEIINPTVELLEVSNVNILERELV